MGQGLLVFFLSFFESCPFAIWLFSNMKLALLQRSEFWGPFFFYVFFRFGFWELLVMFGHEDRWYLIFKYVRRSYSGFIMFPGFCELQNNFWTEFFGTFPKVQVLKQIQVSCPSVARKPWFYLFFSSFFSFCSFFSLSSSSQHLTTTYLDPWLGAFCVGQDLSALSPLLTKARTDQALGNAERGMLFTVVGFSPQNRLLTFGYWFFSRFLSLKDPKAKKCFCWFHLQTWGTYFNFGQNEKNQGLFLIRLSIKF